MKVSTALFIIAAFCLAAPSGLAHGPLAVVDTTVTTSFGVTPSPGGTPGTLPGGGGTPAGGLTPRGKKGTSKPSTSADRARKGATTLSAEGIERMNVDWFAATLPLVDEGRYAERTLPVEFLADARYRDARHRVGVPIMVVMTTEGDDPKRFAESESKWFDERLAVSSLLFNCYRLSLDDMETDFVKRYEGGNVPVILFLDEKGTEQARLAGWNVDAKRTLSTMRKLVKSRWAKNLDRVVSQEIEILKAFDRAIWTGRTETEALATDRKAAEKKMTARLKKQIARREKAIVDAKKAAAEAIKEEAKLLGFLGVTPTPPKPVARTQSEARASR